MKSFKSNHSDHAMLFVLWAIALVLLVYPVSAWMIGHLSAMAVKAAFSVVCGLLLLAGAVLVRGESKR